MTVGRIIRLTSGCGLPPGMRGRREPEEGAGSARETSSFYNLLECLSLEIKFVCLFYNNYVTS